MLACVSYFRYTFNQCKGYHKRKRNKAMKFCETCGDEIYTKDGENQCRECEEAERQHVRGKRRALKREREEAMRSMGLVKVRGVMCGTYWE